MTVREKLNLDMKGLIAHGPVTIVAFGDSVTHGALGFGEINYDTVYHRLLAQKLSAVRNYMPVNVINAGIGGITAKNSLGRMESQVLCHNPDLVIVAFGLNAVNGALEEYLASLAEIFDRCLEKGIETVFMSPNMLNTYVADDAPDMYKEYAAVTAGYQNSGRMDTYMEAACALAKEKGVKVADCYAKWKALQREGEDITMLLANRINHPKAEMHELFAQTIFDVIMEDGIESASKESTMYRAEKEN